MKKLMFAAAIAATAAAFADPIHHAVGFEAGGDYNPNTDNSYFYFNGESNSSVVTNESPSSVKRTAWFADDQNANYLALDTEGGTLWRSLRPIDIQTEAGTNIYNLGEARAVAATGTYLDTLVQFTVTEDEAPSVGDDDKLAIWLQAGEGTTNLMVKAKAWALDGGVPDGVATSFTVSNVSVEPNAWCRLTVKAVQTVIDPATGMIIPAFQILIDSTEVAATTPQISTELQDAFTGNSVWLEGMAALASDNKLFPSLAVIPAALEDVTLQGVGFQGTGAVDEIVWTETEDDVFPAGAVNFTLTYTAGDANVATLGAVTYTIDGGEAQTPTEGKIPDGAEVSIAAPTFASGYQLGSLTTNSVEVASPTFPFVFTMTADTTVAITSAQITYTLTVPTVDNATLTSPASLSGFAPGQQVTLTWTADPGYSFNGSRTKTLTVTVNGNEEVNVSEITSALSKDTFTVTIVDIENVTVVATTNSIALPDALSENTATNQYTVEYGDTVTVTATPAEGYEYTAAPEGWTLNEGEPRTISIETNVTEDVELAVPPATAIPVEIAVPTAITELVYDGTEQTGVAGGTGYTLTGTTAATAAGKYTATATLEQGYVWVGGSSEATNITWSIAKASVTATVSLDPTSATYDSAKTTPSAYTTPSVSFGLGAPTLVEGTDYTVAWSAAEVTGAGTFTYTVSPVAGSNYTFTEVSETLTITESQSIEINPGEQDATKYDSAVKATNALDNVTIVAAPAVTNVLEGEALTTYTSRFEKKVVYDETTGKYAIEVGLKASEEALLQTQANGDAGTLVNDLSAATATVQTTPGFYYSVKYGPALDNMSGQTAGELATTTTKEITLPAKSGTSGFYQVVISIVPNEAVTP